MQFVVWFNIITFTLMFAGISFNFISYKQKKLQWQRFYMLYEGCYALWLLLSTYGFFNAVFLENTPPYLDPIMAIFRAVLSVGIGFFGPAFLLSLFGKKNQRQVVSLVFAAAVVVMVVPSFFLLSGVYNLVINYIYNGALLFFTIYCLLQVRRFSRDRVERNMLPFLYLSTVSYGMIIVYGTILVMVHTGFSGVLGVLAVGLFCISWAILDILLGVRDLSEGNERGLPLATLKAQYGITERESEIVELLRKGFSSKEIAEKLYISLRTVETHVYNIYRKCEVKNKVELINMVR